MLAGIVASIEGGAYRRHPKLLVGGVFVLTASLAYLPVVPPSVVAEPTVREAIPQSRPVPKAETEPAGLSSTPEQPCPDCPDMKTIAAGSAFLGGRPDEIGPSDSPKRRVVVSKAFAISRFEITVGQFERFIEATRYQPARGCLVGDRFDASASWREPGFRQGRDYPVTCVSFVDVRAYANWLSNKTGLTFRLPSETEWEYAARAGTPDPFITGANLEPGDANFGAFLGGTRQVGSSRVNDWGLADVHGNVGELTWDCWTSDGRNLPTDERAVRLFGDCTFRSVRGGSWRSTAAQSALTARGYVSETTAANWIGFRLVRDFHAAGRRPE